jgi:hypothetical protein
VTCPKCGGIRRIEFVSQQDSEGEYRCPTCDELLEVLDGKRLIAYRVTIAPLAALGRMRQDAVAHPPARIRGTTSDARAKNGNRPSSLTESEPLLPGKLEVIFAHTAQDPITATAIRPSKLRSRVMGCLYNHDQRGQNAACDREDAYQFPYILLVARHILDFHSCRGQ